MKTHCSNSLRRKLCVRLPLWLSVLSVFVLLMAAPTLLAQDLASLQGVASMQGTASIQGVAAEKGGKNEKGGDENGEDGDKKEGKGKGGDKSKKGIQPYDEVITDDAKSDSGVFTVHRIGEKVFYEIPEAQLGAEFLWVSRIAKTPAGLGHGGQKLGSRVVQWVRQGDKILLQEINYGIVADSSLPVAQAVASSNTSTVLRAFDIKAMGGSPVDMGEAAQASDAEGDSSEGSSAETVQTESGEEDGIEKDGAEKDGAGKDAVEKGTDPVIDVTELFTKEVAEFSARSRIGAGGFAADRAYVERIASYPENIEVRASHTFTKPPTPRGDRRPAPARRFGRTMSPGSATVEMAYSMIKLPEEPMMPRLYDARVGYFSLRQVDFGRVEHRAQERRFITRWRLEKKDPSATVSEPVQPIEYWIDPATPKKWISYIRQGIEDWQPAFEEAGFSNAIVARDAPTPEEDPEWSPEDSRYSVVRWLASSIQNASGPHVHDPRTGEILESDIQFYHNIQNLLRDWYFVQVAPLDPRAQKLPMPDDLMGELLRYVVAHEVGHTLGFQHNMKASSNYPLEKLRDPKFLAEWGHTPTLMDYSRFNYVVQPEDGVAPKDLFPTIGPYDKWATKWGYAPIDSASNPDDELETLDAWAREQDEKPWLRFSTSGSAGSDPGELTEAVGDADAVAATKLGVKNLRRVLDLILPATDWPGSGWEQVEELYGAVIGQWTREMNHVAAIVGGFDSREVHRGQDGLRFEPISRERQMEAVGYLQSEAFSTPTYFLRQDILGRIEPSGVTNRIRGAQSSILRSLLRPSRLTRLVEQEAMAQGKDAYTAVAFLDDLRLGIFSELSDRRPQVEIFRRGVQQAFVEVVGGSLSSSEGGDARAFLRGQLVDLRRELTAALQKAEDSATRYHLQDLRDQIGRTLDPKFAENGGDRAFGLHESSWGRDAEVPAWEVDPLDPTVDLGCWVDGGVDGW